MADGGVSSICQIRGQPPSSHESRVATDLLVCPTSERPDTINGRQLTGQWSLTRPGHAQIQRDQPRGEIAAGMIRAAPRPCGMVSHNKGMSSASYPPVLPWKADCSLQSWLGTLLD